ncbi:MAG: hypothetical protein COT18_02645 [Elusimicrobia bacterium CG08_land_8_20_14_0_20_59_10]|nr:MAG: hypothetical protein COT18_02645 [Elusimicrobia bacterium CG08_land_8_20_14_0_20_59_10]
MNPKPLVLHIITRLEPGGSSRNTVDSCAAQTGLYDVVLLYGPHKGSAGLLALLPPEVKRLEVPDLQRELCPRKDRRAFLALKAEIARLNPALVHTHTSKAGALGRLAARAANSEHGRRARIVHTPHGHLLYGYYGFFRTLLFRLAERYLATFTDRLVALTPGELRESTAAGIGRPQQWAVAHSGVDLAPAPAPARREDFGIHSGDTVIGTVGRLEPVKGMEYLLRAAALLSGKILDANPKFVIVGGGELEPELRKLSVKLGVEKMVIFTGPREDVPALLPMFDVYVQPSLNEAMGRAPLEAQAAGLPVVVSRVCGLPDVIQEEKTGVCVPPGDAKALAGALERFIIAPKLRKRMGGAAREWALSKDVAGLPRFGAASMNRKLISLYDELLGAG